MRSSSGNLQTQCQDETSHGQDVGSSSAELSSTNSRDRYTGEVIIPHRAMDIVVYSIEVLVTDMTPCCSCSVSNDRVTTKA